MSTSEQRKCARIPARLQLFSPRSQKCQRPPTALPRVRLLPALVILTQMASGFAGAVVAQTPKAAKAAPPPVYYAPPPVVYAPPRPVYYAPPAVYYGGHDHWRGHRHHHHHHRGHDGHRGHRGDRD